MNLLLAGASGFIGRHLVAELLSHGHNVRVLSRNPDRARKRLGTGVEILAWDGATLGPWTDAVSGVDAVVNLAGESIAAGRWTAKRKVKILESRVRATGALVGAIRRADPRPTALVNASAVGYYGVVEDHEVAEQAPPGDDFLARTCVQWEAEALRAEDVGVRVVLTRFGVVLGREGGALRRMLLPFRLFAGGHLGTGRQPFPWVHIADVVGATLFVLADDVLRGPVNVVAPQQVSMKQFCQVLGRVLGRPSWATVPAVVLRLALGEMADMLLTGQWVAPKKLLDSGYTFRFAELEAALQDLLHGD